MTKKIIGGKVCTPKVKVFSTATSESIEEVTENSNIKELEAYSKEFSVNEIKSRVKKRKVPARAVAKLIFKDWKRYYQANKRKLSAEDLRVAEDIFLEDFMSILNRVAPEIKEGKNVAQLLNLTSMSPDASKVGISFSKIYKKALKLEETQVSVPPAIYKKMSEHFTQLVNVLKNDIFEQDNKIPLLER